MRFEWDTKKNRSNVAKHGVSFEVAALVFEDPLALSVLDPCESEERWLTMGMVGRNTTIIVVHTIEEKEDDEVVRVISARLATRHERKAYEESQEN